MIAIGLDLSTSCFGWSIWDDDKLMDYGKLKPLVGNLEWRERVEDMIVQLHDIMKKYKPVEAYVEDVPLFASKGKNILVQLGFVQGSLDGLCVSHKVHMNFIAVGTWRKNIGISTGEKDRDSKKIASLEKANELFGLNLNMAYTRTGKYCSERSDDDISDSILVYASTRDKYKSGKYFGR